VAEADPRRFRATVHYDGGPFHGWQIQPSERTVQGEVESALARLLPEPVRVKAAGRTDRGVHAVGQEIAFPAPSGWSGPDLRRALNAVLPREIWIEKLGEAAAEFHPRFDATARRYVYLLGTGPEAASPLRAGRLWCFDEPLDEELLCEAGRDFAGERDFGGFAKSGQPERGTRCHVRRAEWTRTPAGDLRFTIVADRFLHHMVRYAVSTLVEVASGRRRPAELRALLEGRLSEARPPAPAPPEGLYLAGVRYEEGWNRADRLPGEPLPDGGTRPSGRESPARVSRESAG